MTCPQVQLHLSLYLYGELPFSEEEAVEQHLDECALCQAALVREKSWHSALKSEQLDAPLDLLSDCRRELRRTITSAAGGKPAWTSRLLSWADSFGVSPSRWSARLAAASFLVIVGFGAGRLINVHSLDPNVATEMGVFDPATSRIRDIQTTNDARVRIIFDQVHEGQVFGRADDTAIRRVLLAAAEDPTDPSVRVDSVEILKNQNGNDVRDALLSAARRDANAGVRLKAIEGLRRFVDDPQTREGLTFVLENDSNPGVRSRAIDVLAPANNKVQFSPELVNALQDVMRSDQSDDYMRMRCFQLLNELKSAANVY